ncbi:family 20 glycosylhydrolase [Agromyces sp. CCNWLW203]|uniref:family 20 glycosylhydrolase n=1 Tax=Agromyces sp. CCNWLW203 TaxID=3112842 RepID=UPI002F96ABF6
MQLNRPRRLTATIAAVAVIAGLTLVASPGANAAEPPPAAASNVDPLANATVSQSSKLDGDASPSWGPELAIDGDTSGVSPAITHTAFEANPWWQADLGSVHDVESVVVWNRTDCCTDRLASFSVFLSAEPFTSTDPDVVRAQPGIEEHRITTAPSRFVTIPVELDARYLRIQIEGEGILSLAEVQLLPTGHSTSMSRTTVPAFDTWADAAGSLTLDESTRVVIDPASRDLAAVAFGDAEFASKKTTAETAQVFARDLAEVSGLDPEVGTGTPRAGDVVFDLEDTSGTEQSTGRDGYALRIADGVVRVSANTTSGLYYGGRSVLQALRAHDDHRTLGNGSGLDVPSMALRANTIDVSREYWEPRNVEDVIRQMGWQKQNVLIFHFDDAEYFRLNSPAYPGLADPAFSYDREQIQRFVELGAEHNVTVVPAFEYPAHVSAKASYFHIGMGDGPLEVEPGYGERDTGADATNTCGQPYTHSHLEPDFTLNFMNPKAMRVSKEMLDEFVPWFDAPWVHIGGDEVPSQLNNCPALQAWFAQQPDIKTLADVEASFINELDAHLEGMGKRTVAYNGFENGVPAGTRPKVDTDVIVQLWTGPNNPASLAAYDKIMGNGSHYYLVPARVGGSTYPNVGAIFSATAAAMHVDPANPRHLGLGMHIWGDDLGWAEGQYLESIAYLPRSATAERTWNAGPPATGETLATFTARLAAIGTAPDYSGVVPVSPTDDGRPIHDWVAADTAFPAGTFDAHSTSNRRPLTEVCGLNGMTPLFSNVSNATDPVQGAVKQLGGNGAAAGWHMGAAEVSGDWSYAVNVKVPASVTGRVQLLDSRSGAWLKPDADGLLGTQASSIDFALAGSGQVGFVNNGNAVPFSYAAPRDQWVQLVFVSSAGSSVLYANGAQVGSVGSTLPLPRAWFAAPRLVQLQGMQVYAEALSSDEVAAQYGTGVPVVPEANCQPRFVPEPPAELKDVVEFEPGVEVEVDQRCLGGKVFVTARVHNLESVPIGVVISTAYGDKRFAAVAAGKNAAHAFNTRSASIDAGAVVVTATLDDGSGPVSGEYRVEYPEHSC